MLRVYHALVAVLSFGLLRRRCYTVLRYMMRCQAKRVPMSALSAGDLVLADAATFSSVVVNQHAVDDGKVRMEVRDIGIGLGL